MALTIRAISEKDSVAELTALLHAAYARLSHLGFNYTAVDQSADITRQRIKGGECYLALDGNRLAGTILFRRHSRGCAWYRQPHVAAIHQFAVLPSAQRRGVGSQLLEFTERRGRDTGAAEIALDTAEGAAHLVTWYARKGYRQVAIEQWEGKTYRSLILSKALGSPAM